MMSDDPVQRVAETLIKFRHHAPGDQARAVIEAMREPTRKMADRGYAVRPIEDCWRAMIDAALEQKAKAD